MGHQDSGAKDEPLDDNSAMCDFVCSISHFVMAIFLAGITNTGLVPNY